MLIGLSAFIYEIVFLSFFSFVILGAFIFSILEDRKYKKYDVLNVNQATKVNIGKKIILIYESPLKTCSFYPKYSDIILQL